jgi:hypothetical protein
MVNFYASLMEIISIILSRSYELNFEVSSFIYDPAIAQLFRTIFEEDMKECISQLIINDNRFGM